MDHRIDFEFEVSVKSLLEKKFSTLSFAEKKQIIAQRPTPDLNITQLKRSKHHDFTRTFNNEKYAKFKFLAGCPTKNKLYCWWCLCFATKESTFINGFDDLNHLEVSLKRHIATKNHMDAAVKFKFFLFRKSLNRCPKTCI